MIVKIKFSSLVKYKRVKSKMYDSIRIHSDSIKSAKEVFVKYTSTMGIRGDSGIFYPLGAFGIIKFKSAKEVKQ
jgi:hypothetical protein